MPIYNGRCRLCGSQAEWFSHKALTRVDLARLPDDQQVELGVPVCCQRPMDKVVSKLAKQSHSWPADGLHLEHAGEHGKTFYSKKELKDWCKEKGVSSGALL